MNDAMKRPDTFTNIAQTRNPTPCRPEKKFRHPTKKYDSQLQLLEQSFHSLNKVNIAQKKLERNAKLKGLEIKPEIKEEQKLPISKLSPFESHQEAINKFEASCEKCVQKPKNLKQKMRNAAAYTRAIGLHLKEILRPVPLPPKSRQPNSLSPTLLPKTMPKREIKEYSKDYISFTDQSGSASSSSTNSPEVEIRQRPQVIPMIKLIPACVEQENFASAESKSSDTIENTERLLDIKKKEKLRRHTEQHKIADEIKSTSTFLMNMERLAYDHVTKPKMNGEFE